MDTPDTSLGFRELGLAPAVAQAVEELGYESPTPVQSRCIPHLLAGRDLLGQAQTGTGKTAAFALPLLSRVDPDQRGAQVLVLTPTRELALQVAEAFQRYAQHLKGFLVLPIYGGQGYGLQLSQLRRHPQVIVGTPGRVMDHLKRGTLVLDALKTLVLDEADEMLNMGFAEDIDWIFEQTPPGRQVALFSATMPPAIRRVAQTRLSDPIEVRVAADSETVDTIDQHHCVVTRFHKLDVLTRILELEPFDGMLIFVRTKHATVELADKLKAHGFAAEALNGDMSQEMRERTVERLKQGQLDILVATDVAARGLDVERLSHVVNYDIPTDPSAYVHRIGRTGRAGRAGRAILLVEPRERGLLRAIERTIRRTVPAMEPPSASQLSESRIDRFTAELRKTLTEQDLDFFYRLVARLGKDEELEMLDIAAALAYLNQRERPLDVKPDSSRRQRHERTARDEGLGERHARAPRGGGDARVGATAREPARGAGRDRARRESGGSEGLVTYRIEVGHRHGATPREIVGAIANESGLEGRYIGRIEIHEDHAFVDLPQGMPREIFNHLKRVFVRGQPLRISLATGARDAAPGGKRATAGRAPRPPSERAGASGSDRPSAAGTVKASGFVKERRHKSTD
ncbi:MAG: DEAD/DEAH box helicase [Thiocapsa sp.]|nr:DEAD/DEAH box helicase [Thiocapsa sp.]MCG6896706.1 DEAD/DEAH box helicase [Thiocapsa sp.]